MRSETVGYCALCNQQVLYVAAHGTSSRGGTRGEIMDPKPLKGGKWHRTGDGSYARLDNQTRPGLRPHRCTRFPPQRWTRDEVDRWYQSTLEKLSTVRQRWCVETTSWAVRPHQCLLGTDDPSVEDLIGEQIAVRDRVYAWNTSPNRIADCYRDDYSAGAIPMISLSLDGYSDLLVAEILLGTHDAYWHTLFAALAGLGHGLIQPWYSANISRVNPSYYTKMWQRVHSIAVQQYVELDWIWASHEHDPGRLWRSYYPGDQYVDWVGLELSDTTFNQAGPWRLFANEHRKPFAITHSVYTQGKVVTDPDTGVSYDKDGSVTGRSLIMKTAQDVAKHPNTALFVAAGYVGSSVESAQQYKQLAKTLRRSPR